MYRLMQICSAVQVQGGYNSMTFPLVPCKEWMSPCRQYSYVCNHNSQICCAEHLDEWRVLFDSTSPHVEPLPSDWQARLGPFQRLLLLRALRQDKLTQAISKYVADSMGR